MMGQNEFLATNEFIDWLAGYACKPAEGWVDEICENVLCQPYYPMAIGQ